jgi:hypothetical protein
MQRRRRNQVTYITHFRVTLVRVLPRTATTHSTSTATTLRYKYCHFELHTYDDIRRHTTYHINLEMVILTYHLPVLRVPSSCSTACTSTGTSTECEIQVQDTAGMVPGTYSKTGTCNFCLVQVPVQYRYFSLPLLLLRTSTTQLWIVSKYGVCTE